MSILSVAKDWLRTRLKFGAPELVCEPHNLHSIGTPPKTVPFKNHERGIVYSMSRRAVQNCKVTGQTMQEVLRNQKLHAA